MANHQNFNIASPFISIVTPVYNAEKFIIKAVESALSQPETAEVILVEDNSSDNSYGVCQSLIKKYDCVHLFIHEGHTNKGAGASRNLGIRKAQFDYISFLDADDFFLENRFSKTKKVLQEKSGADGVYEAIGVNFDSKQEKERWAQHKGGASLTTIEDNIAPDDLFWHQSPIGKKGYTSLDGLTVKKTALEHIGLFDPELRLHQDSDLFMRLTMACDLYPGQLKKPVAMRGLHENNRVTKFRPIEDAIHSFEKMLKSTHKWALKNGYDQEAQALKKRIRYSRILKANSGDYNDSLINLNQYLQTIKKHPSVLLEGSFYIFTIKFILRYLLYNN